MLFSCKSRQLQLRGVAKMPVANINIMRHDNLAGRRESEKPRIQRTTEPLKQIAIIWLSAATR